MVQSDNTTDVSSYLHLCCISVGKRRGEGRERGGRGKRGRRERRKGEEREEGEEGGRGEGGEGGREGRKGKESACCDKLFPCACTHTHANVQAHTHTHYPRLQPPTPEEVGMRL